MCKRGLSHSNITYNITVKHTITHTHTHTHTHTLTPAPTLNGAGHPILYTHVVHISGHGVLCVSARHNYIVCAGSRPSDFEYLEHGIEYLESRREENAVAPLIWQHKSINIIIEVKTACITFIEYMLALFIYHNTCWLSLYITDSLTLKLINAAHVRFVQLIRPHEA